MPPTSRETIDKELDSRMRATSGQETCAAARAAKSTGCAGATADKELSEWAETSAGDP